MTAAPVAIFVYNRPHCTRKMLTSLLANRRADETDVRIFSDAAADKRAEGGVASVRRLLRETRERALKDGLLRSMTIVEREENLGVEANITSGIEEMMAENDRLIVVEDDIVTSPHFLTYMNDALRLYENEGRVMHVSGFTNLALEGGRDFYFTPHMSGWGWATWREKWQAAFQHYRTREEALEGLSAEDIDALEYGGAFPCLKMLERRPIPWDTCWEIAIRKAGGLCLTPARTLVRNVGLGGGTHFGRRCPLLWHYDYDRVPRPDEVRLTRVDSPQAEEEKERLFAEAIRDWGIRYTLAGRALRALWRRRKG